MATPASLFRPARPNISSGRASTAVSGGSSGDVDRQGPIAGAAAAGTGVVGVARLESVFAAAAMAEWQPMRGHGHVR